MGVIFLISAPSCRLPVVVEVIGILSLIAAAAIVVIGRTRLDSFLAWWLGRPQPFIRISSIGAIGFGGLLIFSGA